MANPMTEAHIDKEPLVDALTAEWEQIDAVLSGLPDEAWALPALPGWTVQDAVAHIVGTESMLAGDEVPSIDIDVSALDHVRNDIGAANERWVSALRSEAPSDVLGRFRAVVARRRAALAAITQSEFDSPAWTPVGMATYGRFMQIRVFDCWMHEQDIRRAVGRPGHETGRCAELSLDEVARALGYIVGKRAGAPDGSAVTISLRGPLRRDLHVLVDGRAKVVDQLGREATASLRMSSSLFFRLAGGREDPVEHLAEIELAGDVDLATRLATNLAFTI
jgi:uncharacterized protein (TIGR03083 family)